MCLVPIYMASGVAQDAINNPRANARAATLNFCCSTEEAAETDHHLSARAGYKHCLVRWEFGSVIPYVIGVDSFPTPSHALFVGDALAVAATDWNSKNIGVQFKRAAEGERPVFTVEYEYDAESTCTGQGDVTYAIAFFPSRKRRLTLRVFRAALAAQSHQFLANILRHELGHILGLRHEDANHTEPDRPSVELTPPNRASIMRSTFLPRDIVAIQQTDVMAIRRLYALQEGSNYGGFTVKSVEPAARGQQHAASKALNGTFPARPTESSLVGAGTRLRAATGHNTIIAVCFAVSVGFLILLAMSPRTTVVCSS